MNATIRNLVETIVIGETHSYLDLTIVAIVGPVSPELVYVSLGAALEQRVLEITEVSEGGSVPELAVINESAVPVLLVDGEELVGAKQDRILNASVLVPPRARLALPVSCTEVGRWRHVSPAFADSGVVAARTVRQAKNASVQRSLASSGRYASDQRAAWDHIASLHERTGTTSATSAMRDAFASRESEIEGYVSALPAAPRQVGMVALVESRIVGLDWVSRPEVYARLHPKLVRSYAIDCLANGSEGVEAEAHVGASQSATESGRLVRSRDMVQRFLELLLSAHESTNRSVGLGSDHRLTAGDIFGSALVHEGEVIHLAAFPVDADH